LLAASLTSLKKTTKKQNKNEREKSILAYATVPFGTITPRIDPLTLLSKLAIPKRWNGA
jgi:hypothetical protein